MPDVRVENEGTVFIFWLQTDAARDWADENVDVEDYMLLDSGFACEHRCARDIALGMLGEGLVVE